MEPPLTTFRPNLLGRLFLACAGAIAFVIALPIVAVSEAVELDLCGEPEKYRWLRLFGTLTPIEVDLDEDEDEDEDDDEDGGMPIRIPEFSHN